MSSVIPPEIEPPKHLQKPLGLSLKSLPLSSPLGTARQPLLLQLKPLQALPPVSQFLQASLLESGIDDSDGNSFNYGDINFTNSTNISNQEPDQKQTSTDLESKTPPVENKLTQNPVQLQSLSDVESPMLPESGFGEIEDNSGTNSPNIDIVRHSQGELLPSSQLPASKNNPTQPIIQASLEAPQTPIISPSSEEENVNGNTDISLRSQNLASNPQDFSAVTQTPITSLRISLSAKAELNQELLDSPQTTSEIPNVPVQPGDIQRTPEIAASTPENFGQQVTPQIPNVPVQPGDIQRTPETAASTPENFGQQVTPKIPNVPVQPGDIQRTSETAVSTQENFGQQVISEIPNVSVQTGDIQRQQVTPEIPNVSVQTGDIQRTSQTAVSTPENFGQQVTPEIPNVPVQPGDIQRTPEIATSTPENFGQQVTLEIPNVPVQTGDIQRTSETATSTPENFGQQVTPEISLKNSLSPEQKFIQTSLDEPLEKSSIVKNDINPTTYQTPETLVEQILPVQPKSIQPSLKKLIQTSALSTTEFSTKDSGNEPKVKDILKIESINIQAQINSQNPAISKPLGVRKPLFQQSDLSLPNINNNSELLQNSNLALAGEEIGQEVTNQLMRSTTEHLVTNDSTTDKNIQKVALPQPIEAPESWSNIEELLSETTSNKKNVEETQQQPSTNFHSDPANRIHRSIEKSNPQIPENLDSVALPDSWSNISELMGESSQVKTDDEKHADNFTPVSITAPSSVDRETEPVTLTSPTIQKAREQTNIQKGSKEGEINKEDLEIVVQAVYKLIRERLEIDKERRDNYRVSPPNWSRNLMLNFSNSKASEGGKDSKNNSQIDAKLQLLTMQIYDSLRHKLEIARERQGTYTGRFY